MHTYKWLLIGGSIMFLAAFVSLVFSPFHVSATSGPNCDATYCSYVDTTVTDFAQGRFYATGLRNVGNDGAVQLLPVGLTSLWGSDYYSLPVARAELSAVIYKDIIYVIGGYDSLGHLIGDVISATTFVTGPIKPPGWQNIGSTSGKQLPRASMAAVISPTQSGGFIYVLGGDDGVSAPSDKVSYIQLNLNGQSTGDWQTATPLIDAVFYPQAVVRNGYLYIMGGLASGFYESLIYRAQIHSDGTLGAWNQEATTLSPGRSQFGAVTWQNSDGTDYLYVVGGETDGPSVTAEVDFGSFANATVNPLTTTLPLPAPWKAHVVVQGNGQLFSTGGLKEGSGQPVTDVNAAVIDTTYGSLYGGAIVWVNTQPLKEARWGHGAVINSGGEIYVIGGYGSGTTLRSVEHGSTSGFGKYYATKGSYLSAPMYLEQVRNLKQITLNSTITDSVNTTITVQYRVGNSRELTSTWKTLGPLISGTANDTNYAVNETGSFFQYQALFTSTLPYNLNTFSPALNAVTVRYPAPATPTPTNTPTGTIPTLTPTPTGVISPDLTILGIGSPAGVGSTTYQTMTVRIANIGSRAFRPIPIPTLAIPLQRSQPPVVRGKPLRLGGANRPSGAYFAWIDLYVDRAIPSGVTDLGNCQLPPWQTIQPYVYIGDLPIGTYKDYSVPCLLTDGPHTFYAQVDTCDNPSANPDYQTTCSPTAGYVLELNENNNIFGPVTSGSVITQTLTYDFLPDIQKNK